MVDLTPIEQAKTEAEAQEAYLAILRSTQQAYEAITGPAREAYYATQKPAQEACNAIKGWAYKAYRQRKEQLEIGETSPG